MKFAGRKNGMKKRRLSFIGALDLSHREETFSGILNFSGGGGDGGYYWFSGDLLDSECWTATQTYMLFVNEEMTSRQAEGHICDKLCSFVKSGQSVHVNFSPQ
jgi:hypothetical protein